MMDIRSTPPTVRIHQYPAELRIENKLPSVEVHKEQIQIRIDQSQCFEEAGLKGISALRDEISSSSKSDVLKGIERVSAEGDSLRAVQNKRNPIPDIAYSKLFDKVDYNIELMPRSKPKIEFIGGELDIKVHEGYVNIQATPVKPQIDIRLGSIEFNYTPPQQDTVEIKGNNIDSKV